MKTPLGWLLYGPDDQKLKQKGNSPILLVHESLRKQYEEVHEAVDVDLF